MPYTAPPLSSMPLPPGTKVKFMMDDGVTYEGELTHAFSGLDPQGIGLATLRIGWVKTYQHHDLVVRGTDVIPITIEQRLGDRIAYWAP